MKTLYVLGIALFLIFSIQTANASTLPSGCTATSAFSSTTGHPCAISHDCAPGALYSALTGKPCVATSTYLPGCTSTLGFSATTGSKCDGSVPVTTAPVVQPTYSNVQPVSSYSPQSQQSANTQIQAQIAQLQQQVNQLRATAQSQEQAYITGTTAALGQGLAQRVATKEASDEAPLIAQIQQLQSELR